MLNDDDVGHLEVGEIGKRSLGVARGDAKMGRRQTKGETRTKRES